MIDPARKPTLGRVCEAVCRALTEYNLPLADKAVYDASVIALLTIFEGASTAEVQKKIGVDAPITIELGRHFENLSAAEVAFVAGHVRLALWPAHYMTRPDSRCGQQWQATLERAAAADRGERLN